MARKPSQSLRRKFEDMTAEFEPRMRNAFRQSITNVVDGAEYQEVVRSLISGDINKAMRALNINPSSFRPIDNSISSAFEKAGSDAVSQLPKIKGLNGGRIPIRFNMRSQSVEARLRESVTGKISGFTNEMEKTARNIMSDGLANGRGARAIARDLLGVMDKVTGQRKNAAIGLAHNQQEWLSRARGELQSGDANSLKKYMKRTLRDKRYDRTILKVIEGSEKLSDAQIDRMIARYSDRLLRSRAETIARTEVITALNNGKMAAYEQAAEDNDISSDDAVKVWISERDPNVRHDHREADGKRVIGIKTPFQVGESQLLYPHDTSLGAGPDQIINCRCTFVVRLNYERAS